MRYKQCRITHLLPNPVDNDGFYSEGVLCFLIDEKLHIMSSKDCITPRVRGRSYNRAAAAVRGDKVRGDGRVPVALCTGREHYFGKRKENFIPSSKFRFVRPERGI